jgi:hypothetical protein
MMTAMRTRAILALLVALPLTLSLGAETARAIDLKVTPPPREREALPQPNRDLGPARPAMPDRPKFLGPLSKETRSGRAGAAGVPAPNPSLGSRVGGDHDTAGWPGAGFAIEWGRGPRTN